MAPEDPTAKFLTSLESLDFADKVPELAGRLKSEVGRVIVGQERVVEEILISLFAGGHALLEGVPGLAKTLLVNTIASALSLKFGRVQFTPDLMPSDITGSTIIHEAAGDGTRRFVFRPGPIFVNMLLADEINRSPPKTQAALLEGMGERQVTVAGSRHALPALFFVLATQNPIEQDGTYPLPEAQLDRFLLKVVIDYPSHEEEHAIARKTTGTEEFHSSAVLLQEQVLALQSIVRALPASTHIIEYATRIVRASRPEDSSLPWVRQLITWGAGPRATQAMILAAKAHTLLRGRYSVTRSDVRAVALPVLRHRVCPSFQADAEELSVDEIVARLVLDTSEFPSKSDYDAQTRKILRL